MAARPAPASPIDAPGTAEAAWRDWPELARLPTLDVAPWASAVVVAAHPDDEVLGPGGIIAMLAAAGARLRVIAVTDGESSHGDRADRAALIRRRAAERQAALHALGAGGAEIIRLGLPDAALDGRDADIAAALDGLVTGFDGCLASWAGDAARRPRGRGPRDGADQPSAHRERLVLPRLDVALGPARRPARAVAARRPVPLTPAAAARKRLGPQLLHQPARTPPRRQRVRCCRPPSSPISCATMSCYFPMERP